MKNERMKKLALVLVVRHAVRMTQGRRRVWSRQARLDLRTPCALWNDVCMFPTITTYR